MHSTAVAMTVVVICPGRMGDMSVRRMMTAFASPAMARPGHHFNSWNSWSGHINRRHSMRLEC